MCYAYEDYCRIDPIADAEISPTLGFPARGALDAVAM
jgi:hypothetical protein